MRFNGVVCFEFKQFRLYICNLLTLLAALFLFVYLVVVLLEKVALFVVEVFYIILTLFENIFLVVLLLLEHINAKVDKVFKGVL